MPPKGKGRKSKGKKKKDKRKSVDLNKLTNVDRCFCELNIADLKKKISTIITFMQNLKTNSSEIKEKIRELDEDFVDKPAQLTQTVKQIETQIETKKEQICDIHKRRMADRAENSMKKAELNARFRAMHNQLTSEVKKLNGHLNALEEFRVNQGTLLRCYEELVLEQEAREEEYRKETIMIEATIYEEREGMKKDIEQQLLNMSEEFAKKREIQNAGYTRRLIRENIALKKETERMQEAETRMLEELKAEQEKHEFFRREYRLFETEKRNLLFCELQKLEKIEKLTSDLERVRVLYLENKAIEPQFRAQEQELNCEHYAWKKAQEELRKMQLEKDKIRLFCNEMLKLQVVHEEEEERLRTLMERIKGLVIKELANRDEEVWVEEEYIEPAKVRICVSDSGPPLPPEQPKVREKIVHDMLYKLSQLVAGRKVGMDEMSSVETIDRTESSIYRPGKIGLVLPPAADILELFQRDAAEVLDMQSRKPEWRMRKPRRLLTDEMAERGLIIDPPTGSELVISSSKHDQEPAAEGEKEEKEEEEEAGAGAGASSSDD